MSVKYTTPAQHKSNLRNVYGTFAIEGMTISKDTRSNLDRIGNGQASYQQVVNTVLVLRYHPLLKSVKGILNHVHHGVADSGGSIGQKLHAMRSIELRHSFP